MGKYFKRIRFPFLRARGLRNTNLVCDDSDSPAARSAFSLVEAVIAISVVALLLTMSLNAIGSAQRTTRSDLNRRQAQEIAQALLAEIASQAYEDPLDGLKHGPNSVEAATGNRSLFNDVQDYDGWIASPPQYKNGSPHICPSNWREEVQVVHLNPVNLADSGGGLTNVARLTVQIYDNSGVLAQLTTIRTKGVADTRGCCLPDGSCVNVTVSECLLRRGTAGAVGSNCYGATCNGQLAYWPMDEGAGTAAADTVGGHDAALDPGTSWATGKSGTALSMMNSGAVVPHGPGLSLTGNLTICAWVYPASVNSSKIVAMKGSWGGNTLNYALGLVNTDMFFVFDGPSGRFTAISNAGKVQKNQWSHIAATYEASTGNVKLYVDGAQKDSSTTTQTPVSNSSSLLIGRGETGMYFEGSIDDLRLFGVLLSAAELQMIVNNSGTSSNEVLNDLLGGLKLR